MFSFINIPAMSEDCGVIPHICNDFFLNRVQHFSLFEYLQSFKINFDKVFCTFAYRINEYSSLSSKY